MSVAAVHPDPWTVDALFALPEDGMRHELLDGTLLVSPPPAVAHQLAARRLVGMLATSAPPDVEVLEAVGVQVPAGLVVPDVVVAFAVAVHAGKRQLAAGDVVAVIEIVSPSSRSYDRRWKPEIYAEAGIGYFGRVELELPGGPGIEIFELTAGRYHEVVRVRGAERAVVQMPFAVELTPAELQGPRPQR